MADYQPIAYEVHLARGYCCYNSRGQQSRCVFCPWAPIKIIPPMTVNPAILEALKSGVPTTIHSDRMSLVPELTIQNVTIIYRKYEK